MFLTVNNKSFRKELLNLKKTFSLHIQQTLNINVKKKIINKFI